MLKISDIQTIVTHQSLWWYSLLFFHVVLIEVEPLNFRTFLKYELTVKSQQKQWGLQ